MADAVIKVVDSRAVVIPFGSEMLTPLVVRAEAAAGAAGAAVAAAKLGSGKINGWPDPFFRHFDPASPTFLSRDRWYQSVGPQGAGWTRLRSTIFDGFVLRRGAGYNTTTKSGPSIWLDEIGAGAGDTVTVYVLVNDPAAGDGTVFGQTFFSSENEYSGVGSIDLMTNLAGTTAGVIADAAPKWLRASRVVPAAATRLNIMPYNFSGSTGFDVLAVWAFRGAPDQGPDWPLLGDSYFGLRDAEIADPTSDLRAWMRSEAYTVTGAITRRNGLVVTPVNITWPDGGTGVLTITYNVDGTVASLSATHIKGGVTRTVTQPTITYSQGLPVAIPAITVV